MEIDTATANFHPLSQDVTELIGTEDKAFAERLVRQALKICSTLAPESKPEDISKFTLSLFAQFRPASGADALLVTQMICSHEIIMSNLKTAADSSQSQHARDAALKNAMKLMRLYFDQYKAVSMWCDNILDNRVLPRIQTEE